MNGVVKLPDSWKPAITQRLSENQAFAILHKIARYAPCKKSKMI